METFKANWGMWLVATPHAVKGGIAFENQMGILLAEYGNTLIRVVRVGTVISSTYARVFWEPLDEEKRAEWANAVH